MRLLVGLGNPGPGHAGHRHNIGFMAVDEIVRRHGFSAYRQRFQGAVSEGGIGGERLLALKPQTFMNLSGGAVQEAAQFYKIETPDIIVIYDEIDLAPGRIRVKQGGGSGGHNGIRSVDAHIGPDYWRVRLGVGHPGHPDLVAPYVLRPFDPEERPMFAKLIEAVAEAFPLLVAGDANAFMSKVNLLAPAPKPPKPEEDTPPK
ncbi:MAG TPA: aminoacyl-tRNA hydrolase [Dongiaceae bacterium]|jgi:PTH1 family peptidyl-tRNA hydrolase